MPYFFKNPDKSSYQISPDGKHLSFLGPYHNRMNVFVQNLDTGMVERVTSETARDIAGYCWKGNQRIIYRKDFKGDENFHVVAVESNGQNLRDLTPFPGVRAEIYDDLEDQENEMIIGLNQRNPQVFDVYRLNVATGELIMAAANPGNIEGWLTDHQGRVRVAIAFEGTDNILLYRETEAMPFRPIVTTSFRVTMNPLFFTFDDRNVYAASNMGRDKTAIVELDMARGEEKALIFQEPEVDVESLHYSQKRKVLTYIDYMTWKTKYKFLDPYTEQIFTKIRRYLPSDEVALVDHSKNEDFYIVRHYSDRSRGCYYLYDAVCDRLSKLAEISPWLPEKLMCEMKPIVYTSRDGLLIHGYVTLPRGMGTKNLPVVVNPHGGPWARDVWGFDAEAQFLANRGFAVLQMNFRGSTGYGRNFWQASFKEWGRRMQDDITDGVKWLIKEGIANPRRIAIYGGSYGGYATLAGLTFTPELYACGVDYCGVANLFTFMKTIPPYWKPTLERFYVMVGNPEEDIGLLRAASPVFHVDQIKVPVFVAQGAQDPRVNINESNQIVEALKRRGVNVEYMVKENEGHGFHNEENRIAFYKAMEDFLKRNLGEN
ncbi:MAG TPA: S9 family peptidase [Firmicutes bacterium]|nr:S9 family peptidase [Bacillota bacterium]